MLVVGISPRLGWIDWKRLLPSAITTSPPIPMVGDDDSLG